MPLLPVSLSLPRAHNPGLGSAAVAASRSCEAWSRLPSELVSAGISGSTERVFSELQRPWRWHDGAPLLGGRSSAEIARLGAALPRISSRDASTDGSHKLVLSLPADAAMIEAVHMPRAVRRPRVTLCVSSQVGCALACSFCATGALGLSRHLSAAEIVAQILVSVHALGPRHPGELTLVFMGMGEPLHNFANVTRAVQVLTHPAGLGLSPRRITVSTAGLVPQITRLGALSERPLLAVSLNATTNEVRNELMPINRRYPLEVLRAALSAYPTRPRERITIEYVLLAGVNDTIEDAARLADYCAAFSHQINLIPFNAHAHSRFRPPSEAALDAFARAVLARRPTIISVRRSRASDVAGACGQLVAADRLG
jgi:23S rRNA (adenine2503-C2)-methyltransferase